MSLRKPPTHRPRPHPEPGDASDVTLSIADGVGVITLTASHRRNALTEGMVRALFEACDRVDQNLSVGAVVLTGGAYFCAGAHRSILAAIAKDSGSDWAAGTLDLFYQASYRFGHVEVPTIAAVRGGAVGAGLNLALAADLRVVAEDARLASGFQRIGLHPGGGHFALALRGLGRESAAALGLFDQELSGLDAARTGRAWRAVADDDVDREALSIAKRAAADPDLARRAVKTFRLEAGPPQSSWANGVELERGPQEWSFGRASVPAPNG
jgi:enoyl-CoA hydratase